MTTLMKTTELPSLTEKDAVLAHQSGNAIANFLRGEEQISLTLAHENGQKLEATVPAFALRLLAHVLEEVASGRPVTLIPRNTELTTHQAADILGVSRPYLIKQLEAGKIPFRKVGTHRRIRYNDLTVYEEREREERHLGLDELAALSEEMGV